jgi:hypothetical protein
MPFSITLKSRQAEEVPISSQYAVFVSKPFVPFIMPSSSIAPPFKVKLSPPYVTAFASEPSETTVLSAVSASVAFAVGVLCASVSLGAFWEQAARKEQRREVADSNAAVRKILFICHSYIDV